MPISPPARPSGPGPHRAGSACERGRGRLRPRRGDRPLRERHQRHRRIERGTETGTETEQDLPGAPSSCRSRTASRSGRRSRSWRTTRAWPTPCRTTWRAPPASSPTTRISAARVEPLRPVGTSSGPTPERRGPATRRRPRRARRHRRGARHRRGLRAPAAATGGRPTCDAALRRGYDFVGNDRHPNDRYGHGTHVAGTIAQRTNNGHRRRRPRLRGEDHAAAGARRRGRGRLADDRARDPLRGPQRRRRDQPERSSSTSDVTAAEIPDVLSAIRYATRKGVGGGRRGRQRRRTPASPTPRAPARDRGGRDHRARLPGRLLEHRAGPRRRRARAAATDAALDDNSADCQLPPVDLGARIFQQTFRGDERPLASGCRAATRARRWRRRT